MSVLDQLPLVQGKYILSADLKPLTWFRTGGPAEVLFKPKNLEDLQHFLKHLKPGIPWNIIGAGSNILIRDGGVPGVVIKLGPSFSKISFNNDLVTIGGAALDRTVALEIAAKGLGGLEFFIGIPGTIGGAIKMNAGAYGSEVKDCLVSCAVMTKDGSLVVLKNEDLEFTYRHSNLPDDWIVIEGVFKGIVEPVERIFARMEAIVQTRESTQPIRTKTGGSTFKNPANQKAWQLIDAAGCRGLKIGDAQISEKHCNFLVNTNKASASDLENLGELVQKKVLEKTGTMLEWEIRRLGVK